MRRGGELTASFCSGRSNPMRAERASENARLQQALGPRHAEVASKQPVAQRNGDGPHSNRAYARRSPRNSYPDVRARHVATNGSRCAGSWS